MLCRRPGGLAGGFCLVWPGPPQPSPLGPEEPVAAHVAGRSPHPSPIPRVQLRSDDAAVGQRVWHSLSKTGSFATGGKRQSAVKDMNSGVPSPSGSGRAQEHGAPAIEASSRRTLYAANVPTRGIHRADRGTCILPRRLFAPTSPEPAPAAPVDTAPREFRAHEGLMDVHFAPGKSEVLKGDAAALDSTAAWLKQNPHWLVLIEGYTDQRDQS